MSDNVLLAIIAGVLALLTPISTALGAYVAYLLIEMKKQNAAAAIEVAKVAVKTEQVAVETADVKVVLQEATTKTDEKLDGIHKIVNQQRTDMMEKIESLERTLTAERTATAIKDSQGHDSQGHDSQGRESQLKSKSAPIEVTVVNKPDDPVPVLAAKR